MQHISGGNNLALLTTRQITSPPFNHVLATRFISEMKTCSHDRGTNCFPLYVLQTSPNLIPNESQSLNFSSTFLTNFSQKLGLPQTVPIYLRHGFTPENVFFYIYSVLYSPEYRDRYAEFLKTEFPRIPLTSSLEVFHSLAQLGGQLVALHLLEFALEDEADTPADWPRYPRLTQFSGSNPVIEKFPAASKAWQAGTVAINNSSGFSGVPEDVWNFHIGGYQVCHKWLKDRQGRTLSDADILHYAKIVTALHQTIRLMAEIDEAIEAHGGWPIQ